MIRLVKYELHKIWRSRFFLIVLTLLIATNLFFLWFRNVQSPGNISPAAYRSLSASMHGKDMAELDEFLHAELDRVEALNRIDLILQDEAENGQKNSQLRKKYATDFDRYYTTYQEKDYLSYGENLAQEYAFMKSIVLEFSQVADYEGFLKDIEERSERISSISIFAESERGYEKENILATTNAFRGMHGISIQYYPQKGIATALNFEMTDVVTVLAMLLIATVSVRKERDDGLLGLVRANPAGRMQTAVAKFLSFSVSLGVILLCLYGLNLIYCDWLYGLGPLTRTIQSVPLLMRSTFWLTVGQYIGFFLLIKWLTALICGAWVMLAMLIAKTLVGGFLSSLGLIVLHLFIRTVVPATSNLNVLKYANLVSLLRTNELLGRYHNLYWFDRPVSLILVEVVAAIFCFLFFLSLFLWAFSRKYFVKNTHGIQLLTLRKKSKSNSVTLIGTEYYKLLVLQGGAVVLILFAGIQLYTALNMESYINAEEIYYRNYVQPIEGKWAKDKYEWLKEQGEEFAPIHQLRSDLAANKITEEEYQTKSMVYINLLEKMDVYMDVVSKTNELNEKPRKQMVYESGWLTLFDYDDKQDLSESLFVSIVCAVCFASVFAMEYQTGMVKVIAATPLGREQTVRKKLQVAVILCALLAIASLLPHLYIALRDYGLGAWFAPIYSISEYAEAPEIPLFLMVCIQIISRFAAIIFMASVTLVLSQKLGNIFGAMFASLMIFALPIVLSLAGLTKAKWASVYLWFHVCGMLFKPSYLWLWLMLMIVATLIIVICTVFLYEDFVKIKK